MHAITELQVKSGTERREKKNSNLGDSKVLLENLGASEPLNDEQDINQQSLGDGRVKVRNIEV